MPLNNHIAARRAL